MTALTCSENCPLLRKPLNLVNFRFSAEAEASDFELSGGPFKSGP